MLILQSQQRACVPAIIHLPVMQKKRLVFLLSPQLTGLKSWIPINHLKSCYMQLTNVRFFQYVPLHFTKRMWPLWKQTDKSFNLTYEPSFSDVQLMVMYLFHMGNMSVPQSVFVKNDTAGLFMEELFSVFTAFHIANKVA